MSTLTTWTIPGPGSVPLQISAAGNFISFTLLSFVPGGGYVGMLDPSTNHFTQWLAPYTPTSPGDIQNHLGAIWLTSNKAPGGSIVRLEPAGNVATSWTLPASLPGGPRHLAFDPAGDVVFTVADSAAARAVGILHTNTGAMRVWTLPPSVATTSDWVESVAYDAVHGRIYANIHGPSTNSIIQIDVATPTNLTAWSVAPSQTFESVAVDAAGHVFFLGFNAAFQNIISRLDPATHRLTEWIIPAPTVNEFLALDAAGLASFTGAFHTPLALRLDPAVGGATRILTPQNVVMQPGDPLSTITREVLKPETSVVPPKEVPLAPTTSGPFTLWALPKLDDARGISIGPASDRWVTLQTPNAIGRIAP